MKLSCMEPTELVGLLASLRGLNSPTEDSLASLTLMGSLVNTEASLACRPGKLVSGEKIAEMTGCLVCWCRTGSEEVTFASLGKDFLLHTICLHCLMGLLSYWLSFLNGLLLPSLEGGGGLICDSLGLVLTTLMTWATCCLSTLCLNNMLVTLLLCAMEVLVGVLGDLIS